MDSLTEEEKNTAYIAYMTEGDVLHREAQCSKAIKCYTQALELKPTDKQCLVSRSKCYLQLGNNKAALRDAEEALKLDKDYIKGLYQKAEALYHMGDNFEFALVYYHRGHKLRPEMENFRLGIQKAQEAIENKIGDGSGVTFDKVKELLPQLKQEDEKHLRKSVGRLGGTTASASQQKKAESNKRNKELLGELSVDKDYLEKLLQTPALKARDKKSRTNQIYNEASEALSFLKGRQEFWRQQKPLQITRQKNRKARKMGSKEEEAKEAKEVIRKKNADKIKRDIEQALKDIHNVLDQSKCEECLQLCDETMKKIESTPDSIIRNKPELLATVYSNMGTAYYKLRNYDSALYNHRLDLEIAVKHQLVNAEARALDNLATIYAEQGLHQEAIDLWEGRLPLVKTSVEKMRLFHELGQCYLALDKPEIAKFYGKEALRAAGQSEEWAWRINANILIAKAEVKIGNMEGAATVFSQAEELAKITNDEEGLQALAAVQTAMRNAIEKKG